MIVRVESVWGDGRLEAHVDVSYYQIDAENPPDELRREDLRRIEAPTYREVAAWSKGWPDIHARLTTAPAGSIAGAPGSRGGAGTE